MDELFFFFLFSQVGEFFFTKKLPFRHQISGTGWNFFFTAFGGKVFFLLHRLVKFFLFY